MAEELVEYENTIDDDDGSRWVARVLGARRDDGRWVGWIRFRETATDRLLETERETTQPDREDLVYWAKGLTYFYLDGALARARRRSGRQPEERELPPVEKAAPAPDEVGPRLKVTGATIHVNGEPVELTQDALSHAVVGE